MTGMFDFCKKYITQIWRRDGCNKVSLGEGVPTRRELFIDKKTSESNFPGGQ